MQTPFLGVALHSALAHLQFLQIDPKPCTPRGMQPERTRPKEGWQKGPRSDNSKSNKIFVGGIPHNCGETELREYFKKFGVVSSPDLCSVAQAGTGATSTAGQACWLSLAPEPPQTNRTRAPSMLFMSVGHWERIYGFSRQILAPRQRPGGPFGLAMHSMCTPLGGAGGCRAQLGHGSRPAVPGF